MFAHVEVVGENSARPKLLVHSLRRESFRSYTQHAAEVESGAVDDGLELDDAEVKRNAEWDRPLEGLEDAEADYASTQTDKQKSPKRYLYSRPLLIDLIPSAPEGVSREYPLFVPNLSGSSSCSENEENCEHQTEEETAFLKRHAVNPLIALRHRVWEKQGYAVLPLREADVTSALAQGELDSDLAGQDGEEGDEYQVDNAALQRFLDALENKLLQYADKTEFHRPSWRK